MMEQMALYPYGRAVVPIDIRNNAMEDPKKRSLDILSESFIDTGFAVGGSSEATHDVIKLVDDFGVESAVVTIRGKLSSRCDKKL